MGEKRNVYRLLVRKPEGKRPLGRPRRKWIENTKMDLLEIGLSVVDWIGLAQDRYRWRALVNAVMNLRVPLNAGKVRSGYANGGLSSGVQLHRELGTSGRPTIVDRGVSRGQRGGSPTVVNRSFQDQRRYFSFK
jgi:hypothetical protein